jgi:hypothetical protein
MSLRLPDLALVQDYLLVAEVLELQPKHRWYGESRIVLFGEQAQRKHEDRVVRVDGRETVVAALVREYDEVAEFRQGEGWSDVAAELSVSPHVRPGASARR